MKKIAVFGSTGSIGTQTLSVAGFHPDEFEVYAIAANKNAEQVIRSANEFHPKFIGMYDEAAAREVAERCPGITVVSGGEVNSLAALSEVDIVVNGVSGFAGLFPLLSALRAGKTVALANKESIVCGHVVVNRALAEFGGRILPIDSEQSAIFQCLAAGRKEDVRSLILTASGGMFRNASADELARATPQMALRHPTWSMGGKITIDSSTLFNKGLELMEAGWLFDIEPNRIEILIHPQSVVHSMVEFCDGAVFAQMSPPDMRLRFSMRSPIRTASLLSFRALTLQSCIRSRSKNPTAHDSPQFLLHMTLSATAAVCPSPTIPPTKRPLSCSFAAASVLPTLQNVLNTQWKEFPVKKSAPLTTYFILIKKPAGWPVNASERKHYDNCLHTSCDTYS